MKSQTSKMKNCKQEQHPKCDCNLQVIFPHSTNKVKLQNFANSKTWIDINVASNEFAVSEPSQFPQIPNAHENAPRFTRFVLHSCQKLNHVTDVNIRTAGTQFATAVAGRDSTTHFGSQKFRVSSHPRIGVSLSLVRFSMAFGRLGASVNKLSKVVSEEVPGTLSSLKLSTMELNDLTQQLSSLRHKISGVGIGKKDGSTTRSRSFHKKNPSS